MSGSNDTTGVASDEIRSSAVDHVADLLAVGVPEVYRYALRLTGGDRPLAEDLVQETCMALMRSSRSAPEQELSVGWMVVVARRRFVDHLRRKIRESRRLDRMGGLLEEHEPDWSVVEDSEALECLGRLPDAQRAALVFRYVDDLSVAQVAELLDRSVAATESLLARARRELARLVEEARDG